MFCVFQELSSCACKSCFCSMVENLPATTSFIIFYIFFLSVRSISWYSSILSFNSRVYILYRCYTFTRMAVTSSPFSAVGKTLHRELFARLNLSIICPCLNQDIFILYYCKPKRSTIYQKLLKNRRKRNYNNYYKFFRRSFLYPE